MLSERRVIDWTMLWAISGLNTFSSKCPCDPAMVIPLWFPITFVQTIVIASHWVGFIFPGIIDDPASFSGSLSSEYPALGPDPRNLISLAIFIKQTETVFKVPEKLTIASWAARAANLFFAGLKGSLVIFLISSYSIKAMRQAKEEEQADIEEFDEDNIDKGDDTVK